LSIEREVASALARQKQLDDVRLDAVAGGIAGSVTAIWVTPLETWKVYAVVGPTRATVPMVLAHVRENAFANLRSFIPIFGAVCALEFSVIKRVGERHGTVAGVASSAMTGALFLSCADHLLYLRTQGVTPRAAMRSVEIRRWATGFTPMVMREGMWISSVTIFGPAFGRVLQRRCLLGANTTDETYAFCGRVCVGIPSAVMSQWLDTAARMLQVANNVDRTRPASYGAAYAQLRALAQKHNTSVWRAAFRGVVPRALLAATGGALAGGIYEQLRPLL